MDLRRILRHLLYMPRHLGRAFPRRSLDVIEQAIRASEATHCGQIRFVVEGALDRAALFAGLSARERSIEVFSQLRVWDTERNNGLLIYLLLADHDVEIAADRGIDAKVGAPAWESICREMESAFRQTRFEAGVVAGIQAVSRHLARHFPAGGATGNELPDRPVRL